MPCECDNDEEVKKLKEAMFGNGSPETSVLTRLMNIEKAMKTVRNIGWLIVAGIVAIVLRGFESWTQFGPPSESTVAMVEPSLYGGE